MRRIVLATKNKGKIREVSAALRDLDMALLSLADFPSFPEVIEDGQSFLENALKKAKAASGHTGETALADDSGLEVDALGGRPGILSARFSGADADDQKNNMKLLEVMKDVPAEKRGAAFRCVLVLFRPGGDYDVFEGVLRGWIAEKPSGSHGFGYDPLFIVPEFQKTVAELDPDVKNRVSHRGKALQALKKSLQRS